MDTSDIYYEVGDKQYVIPINEHSRFESIYKDAKIHLMFANEHYAVPLDTKDAFIKYVGAYNVTLAVLDDEDHLIPELSIHPVPGY